MTSLTETAVTEESVQEPEDPESLARALEEAAAFFRGEPVKVRIWRRHDDGKLERMPSCRTLRDKIGMTQKEMARLLGTSLSTYQKWEQATRHPSGAALTLLRILEKEPELVMRALAS